jgi:LysM repeat protein
MGNKTGLFFLLILSSLIISCRVGRQNVITVRPDLNAETYIATYKELAVSEMKRSGVPASITLAQGMIESDYGRSKLAREANNHFGIKCHRDWNGPTIRHHDDKRNECFRKYRKPEESFADHSEFLRSGSRYSFLFSLDQTDYKGWARGLKKAGYATNPDYANMLIRKIEEHNLQYFDRMDYSAGKNVAVANNDKVTVINKNRTAPEKIREVAAVEAVAAEDVNSVSTKEERLKSSDSAGVLLPGVPLQENIELTLPVRIMEKNRLQYIVVKDGDTKESIEKEFNLLKWELAKYNDLNPDFIPVPGQLLFLQPKRDKASADNYFYFTVEGDTMYGISQKFGIKLRKLYEMNRMADGEEPAVNEKIWLRTNKPVNQRLQ